MELPKGKAGAGKLLVTSLLDSKDELEERLERCVGIVTSLTCGLSDREANDALNAHICKGTPQHEEICLGLFTLVLTEPSQAQKCYRDLALVSRDGMNIVLNKINHILMEKYPKLQDTCRTQLVWLLRELVKSGVLGADGVCMTFMKQIAGGDVTAKNIWLAENVLEILTEQRDWVLKSSLLVAMAVYTYLRLLVDHHGTPQLQGLRQKEVEFCISLLRERFMDCFMIGRDLVRLLQNVARIPEFEQLWKDILHNPQVLSPQFTGNSHQIPLFLSFSMDFSGAQPPIYREFPTKSLFFYPFPWIFQLLSPQFTGNSHQIPLFLSFSMDFSGAQPPIYREFPPNPSFFILFHGFFRCSAPNLQGISHPIPLFLSFSMDFSGAQPPIYREFPPNPSFFILFHGFFRCSAPNLQGIPTKSLFFYPFPWIFQVLSPQFTGNSHQIPLFLSFSMDFSGAQHPIYG
ncbi:integrator complex subunit 3-like isoform X4 [Myiozetetes cayanensis]|uniref:integrator complex subunit 3-like isoform X4 n=1 Tax=Myiozetetes cayanensis TaxID=478635 RepID=UPI00215E3C1E|nr:integrator complex subunit 3-like isoform X4 [Myiozetetes cayanensis]